jgi:hypothetical protein
LTLNISICLVIKWKTINIIMSVQFENTIEKSKKEAKSRFYW